MRTTYTIPELIAVAQRMSEAATVLGRELAAAEVVLAGIENDLTGFTEEALAFEKTTARYNTVRSATDEAACVLKRLPELVSELHASLRLPCPADPGNVDQMFEMVREAGKMLSFLAVQGAPAIQSEALSAARAGAVDEAFETFRGLVSEFNEIEAPSAETVMSWIDRGAITLPPATRSPAIASAATLVPHIVELDEARLVSVYAKARARIVERLLPTQPPPPAPGAAPALALAYRRCSDPAVLGTAQVASIVLTEFKLAESLLPPAAAARACATCLGGALLWIRRVVAPLAAATVATGAGRPTGQHVYAALDLYGLLPVLSSSWPGAGSLAAVSNELRSALASALPRIPTDVASLEASTPAAGACVHPATSSFAAAANRLLRWVGFINDVLASNAGITQRGGEDQSGSRRQPTLDALRPRGSVATGFADLIQDMVISTQGILENVTRNGDYPRLQSAFFINNLSHILMTLQTPPLAVALPNGLRVAVQERLERAAQHYVDVAWETVARTLHYVELRALLGREPADLRAEEELGKKARALIKKDLREFKNVLESVCAEHKDHKIIFTDPALREALHGRATAAVVTDTYAPYITLCADIAEAAAAITDYADYNPRTVCELIGTCFRSD